MVSLSLGLGFYSPLFLILIRHDSYLCLAFQRTKLIITNSYSFSEWGLQLLSTCFNSAFSHPHPLPSCASDKQAQATLFVLAPNIWVVIIITSCLLLSPLVCPDQNNTADCDVLQLSGGHTFRCCFERNKRTLIIYLIACCIIQH